VSGAAAELLVLIAEHLELEERKVLSLIDRYLTAKEWDAVGGSGLKKFSFSEIKVSFGMILNGAAPEQAQIMRNTLPRVPWLIFSFLGPRAYVKYAARLHSASTVSMARSAA
jgi:hypothetical protein